MRPRDDGFSETDQLVNELGRGVEEILVEAELRERLAGGGKLKIKAGF